MRTWYRREPQYMKKWKTYRVALVVVGDIRSVVDFDDGVSSAVHVCKIRCICLIHIGHVACVAGSVADHLSNGPAGTRELERNRHVSSRGSRHDTIERARVPVAFSRHHRALECLPRPGTLKSSAPASAFAPLRLLSPRILTARSGTVP